MIPGHDGYHGERGWHDTLRRPLHSIPTGDTMGESTQDLPLVVEVMPGQAKEGLVDVFEPDTYRNRTLPDIVQYMTSDVQSVEDRAMAEEVRRGMNGGKLLYEGQIADGNVLAYAVMEETAKGERYLYVQARIIRPQEGG